MRKKPTINEANFSAIVTGKNKCSLENYIAICQALKVKFGTFINADELQTA
ncbi:MAG: helix-turn-helix domain-containing protein [Selenomonadaceae bacterium]|nr:helix-turn-helix domain-containing protein [Selenomonadaceae bacterium]